MDGAVENIHPLSALDKTTLTIHFPYHNFWISEMKSNFPVEEESLKIFSCSYY